MQEDKDEQNKKREAEKAPNKEPFPKRLKTENSQHEFRKAVENNEVEKVKLLLSYPDVNPAADDNWAIGYVASKGYVDMMKVFLSDPRIDPTQKHNSEADEPITIAIVEGHQEIVKLLLADPRVDPLLTYQMEEGHHVQPLILTAIEAEHYEIIEMLLADPRIDPAIEENQPFKWACLSGNGDIVELLWNYVAQKLTESDLVESFRFAIQCNHSGIVKFLLSKKQADKIIKNDALTAKAIQHAAMNDRLKTLEVLLSDSRINPAADNVPFVETQYNRTQKAMFAEKFGLFKLVLENPKSKLSNEYIVNFASEITAACRASYSAGS